MPRRTKAFELRQYEVTEARVRLNTSSGLLFYMDVSAGGLKFYAEENEAGVSHTLPVEFDADALWAMIENEGAPPFRDRAAIGRQRKRLGLD